MESKVVLIVGPTCSGKTKLGMLLASEFNSQIISADSRQIYKYLDIGTAKPSKYELKKVKHFFIDLLYPDQNYNVSKFEKESIKIISQITKSQKLPIVVGGSGLYVKAMVDGIFDTVDIDYEIREKLMKERNEFGNTFIFEKLKKYDPKTASTLLPQNWKRIIRALEVYLSTGKPIWQHHNEYKRNINYNFIQYGLNWKRETLYKNIEKRVDEMIEQGLIDEVRYLLNKGYSKKLNSLNTVGYKEIIEYIEGKISLQRAVELIKRNTRRYAKRQLTWFRKDERINWFNINSEEDINKTFLEICKNIN